MAIWKMALIGLEGRDRSLLETAIDLASGLETEQWELVDSSDQVQVILANIDDSTGKERVETYLSDPNGPLVVPYSAEKDLSNEDAITLNPPLSYKNVTSLLKRLESKLSKTVHHKEPAVLSKRAETTSEPINPVQERSQRIEPVEQIRPEDVIKHKIDWLSDDEVEEANSPILTEVTHRPAEILELTEAEENTPDSSLPQPFNPDSRLLGILYRVIESGKTTLITHPEYPELRIFPDNGWFVFSEELDSYPQMYREPATSFSIEVVEEEIKDELFSGRLPQSLWKLLFTAALFGSEGRLLENLNRELPFYLIHTPYFGMIPHTADHIKIAEYMVNHHEHLETISKKTDVDPETIIDFCNACEAIKLLKNVKTNEDLLIEDDIDPISITELENDTTVESELHQERENPKKTGLIGSLISNLTRSH